jgi:hypothetical protein
MRHCLISSLLQWLSNIWLSSLRLHITKIIWTRQIERTASRLQYRYSDLAEGLWEIGMELLNKVEDPKTNQRPLSNQLLPFFCFDTMKNHWPTATFQTASVVLSFYKLSVLQWNLLIIYTKKNESKS